MSNFQISRIISLALICICIAGCDPYSGFGCIAPEAHPAVEHARSISSEQWAVAYSEIQTLSEIHSQNADKTQFRKNQIPVSLSFLNAEVIRVYKSRGPYVILANCFDERIELHLTSSDSLKGMITLHWAEPTNENPYATGSQILWEGGND